MKRKVKMLDSIAGLADPRSPEDLDKKYQAIRDKNKAIELKGGQPLSDRTIESMIADMKKHDRYGEKLIGFKRDWAFKEGQEVLIPAELAAKWEENGQCVAIEDAPRKAA